MTEELWTAYWTVGEGVGELRSEPALPPAGDAVVIRSICSGISRGTELLVHAGAVPDEVADSMRAPFQVGDFPFPVKYGYLSVGLVEAGPPALLGRRAFCLHPHQDRYVVPAAAVSVLPEALPSERAVLAGAVETAVNAIWDARPTLGDRVAVIGAGMVGCCVAAALRGFPLGRLQLVDVEPRRGSVASRLGVDFVSPEDAAGECDLVFHCSATEAGLARGLDLLGFEGELVELSWFGRRAPAVPLGGAFHARRLSIRASQVGTVAPARRARRTTADRLRLALDLLLDPAYDALLSGRSRFVDLPATMARLAVEPGEDDLCHVVTYGT